MPREKLGIVTALSVRSYDSAVLKMGLTHGKGFPLKMDARRDSRISMPAVSFYTAVGAEHRRQSLTILRDGVMQRGQFRLVGRVDVSAMG